MEKRRFQEINLTKVIEKERRLLHPKIIGIKPWWLSEKFQLNISQEVLRILDEVLSLNGRSALFKHDTPLLGAIPELDSMAVVTLLTSLEEQLGVIVDDDDIDGSTFATVGSLVDFVSSKLVA